MNQTFRIALSALLFSACTVGPDYTPPHTTVPDAWTEAKASDASDKAAAYWHEFGDALLDDLVRQAQRNSPDMTVALARVTEARVRAGAAGSARWPRVDATGSYSNSRLSEHGFIEGLGGGSLGGGGAVFPGQEINLYQAGIDASWELDLFGAHRRDVEATDAEVDTAVAEAHGVMLLLSAATAEQYLQWRGLQEQLELARQAVQIEQDELAIMTERAAAGVADSSEVARVRHDLGTKQADVHALEGERQACLHALERLVGVLPGRLDERLAAASPLPAAPDALAVDVPANVLRARPDVRVAEGRLRASTARIGVATADLYPRFSLTGSFGFQAQKIEDLPDYDSRFWAIGPSLRWPLLDFGRVRAAIAVADAQTQQALAAYQGTVLQALSDVEIALVRLARGREQLLALQSAAAAAGEQQRLIREQYERGVAEFVQVLAAQRSRVDAEEDLLHARVAIDRDFVALGKALGGGWQDAAK